MLEKSNIPNKWKQHTHYTAYDALIHVCGKNRHQSSDFGRSGLAHVCIYSAQTTWLTCGLVHFVRYNYLCMYTCMYIWIGINSWKFMCVCMHGSMDACLSFMSCVCCMCVCVCVCVCVFARKHVYKFCVNLSNENSYMCGYVGIVSWAFLCVCACKCVCFVVCVRAHACVYVRSVDMSCFSAFLTTRIHYLYISSDSIGLNFF